MTSPLARGRAAVADLRRRSLLFDHGVRTLRHYSQVHGSGLAGSVTYYAFLSFFPILALAFFVVGYVSKLYPDARDNLTSAVGTLLPHILGEGDGEIRLSTIQSAAGTAGLIGAIGLLYTGLGWLSGMRAALEVVFEMPRSQYPSYLVGKLRDLASLAVIGLTLLLTVAVTSVVTGSSTWVLDLVGLAHNLAWLVRVAGAVVGIVANTLLFYTLFRLLARPATPRRALWEGALLGAFGFEALKLGSTLLLVTTRGRPAFQAFGIALILLIWINYFSRVVMYAAAWAHTSPIARAARERESRPASADTLALRARVLAGRDGVPAVPMSGDAPAPGSPPPSRRSRLDPRLAFGAGAAAALGLVAMLRRRHD
jgi:membrane protein